MVLTLPFFSNNPGSKQQLHIYSFFFILQYTQNSFRIIPPIWLATTTNLLRKCFLLSQSHSNHAFTMTIPLKCSFQFSALILLDISVALTTVNPLSSLEHFLYMFFTRYWFSSWVSGSPQSPWLVPHHHYNFLMLAGYKDWFLYL